MGKLSQILKGKHGDESRRKHETDTEYLARLVRDSATRNDFFALTFRFSHSLGLSLTTAQTARMIAGYDYPTTKLDRYSEKELSTVAVYMASHARGEPKLITEVTRLSRVDPEKMGELCMALYLAQKQLSPAEFQEIYPMPRPSAAGLVWHKLSLLSLKFSGRRG